MKKIMISVALLIASNSFSQMIETKKLASGTGGWDISMDIENSKDTMTYFYYGYQNMEYTHIVDRASVFFTKKQDLIDFAKTLKILSKKESGANIQSTIYGYCIRLHDFSEEIYITDKRGKYTTISKEDAIIMADEFIANAKFLRK